MSERPRLTLGNVMLCRWMDAEKLSQPKAAKLFGVSQATVCNWRRGGSPRAKHMMVLRDVAGIPLSAWGALADDEPAAAGKAA